MTKDFIGISFEKAKELAKERNLDYRVTKKDDTPYVGTCDFNMDRLNFEIKNNIIIECNLG